MSDDTRITTWYEQYLSSRAISLTTAERFGVRLIDGSEITTDLRRDDGERIEAGILIPVGDGYRLRAYRQPVRLVGLDDVLLDNTRKAIMKAISGRCRRTSTSETNGKSAP